MPTPAQRFHDFAIRVKARFEAVEARALPPGGSSNQMLIKLSGADNDAAWADAPTPTGSTGQTLTAIAGETMGGNRAAYISTVDGKAYLADAARADAQLFCGLTTGAAAFGAEVTIQIEGAMINEGWSWTPSPVFLGTNGLLTQSPPSSGLVVQAGVPIGPSKLRIGPRVVALT